MEALTAIADSPKIPGMENFGPIVPDWENVNQEIASQESASMDPSNLQDQALISRTRNGDTYAFEELVAKYRHQLFSLVCWHAGPAADTDDILQLILCKVWFALKKFDINRPFYPWLRRIAVNRCFDERRRLRRRKALTFAELDIEEKQLEGEPMPRLSDNPFAEENRQELGDMLKSVLAQLPAEYREILKLHHLEQLPYEEIAQRLSCTPQAARVKACRARAALRRLMTRVCENESITFASANLMRILDACCKSDRQTLRLPFMRGGGRLAYCNN